MKRIPIYGLILCLLAGLLSPAFGQSYFTQYRPGGLDWQQLNTEHFKIVFPAGEDSVAWRTARILESRYASIQQLTGGGLQNFPVVLNNYNDLSNGFVTPFHFRSEIEVPPIRGKSQNPRSGNWLEQVAPHELVHALQLSNTGGLGLGGLTSIFSPDFARSYHAAIPSGIIEGLAVEYETESVAPHGGRGNYPHFTNQFEAVFDSPDRWSMGQMVHISSYTRPFGRRYIGGYEFTSWLHEAYGDSTSRRALDFYIDFPFLGYGAALKHATGEWPAALYDEFEKQQEASADMAGSQWDDEIQKPDIPFKGADIHHPKWLDDSTLIFYGSFYNAPPGFYRYDLDTQKTKRLATTQSVRDYIYYLSGDKSYLLYAYNESSPIYDNTFKSELVRLNLSTLKKQQLTSQGRAFAPEMSGNRLLALQTDHASSRLVEYLPDAPEDENPFREIATLGIDKIVQVAVNPARPDEWAVIANRRGLQGLWLVSENSVQEDLEGAPAISFSGASVFDPAWHPDGSSLLFSSDREGTLNIYEYNRDAGTVRQLTDSPYNAFEASYSPGGNRIAFVYQDKNLLVPAVMRQEDFYGAPVPSSEWTPSPQKTAHMNRPELGEESVDDSNWTSSSYSSGINWLKPRAFYPVIEEVSNRNVYKKGAIFHSNNLLQNQSYSLELSSVEDRIWFDLSYTNKSFYPGFRLRLFREPGYRTFESSDFPAIPFLREERGFALSIPIKTVFERNVYFSSLTVTPEFRRSQIGFTPLDDSDLATGFANFSIGNISALYHYKLRQNFRAMQPVAGITLFSEIEHYFPSESSILRFGETENGLAFREPTGLVGAIYTYLAPLERWNQSLRLGIQAITQTNPVFDNQSIVSNGFSEPVFNDRDNLLSFNARYTIPLWFADDGGFTVPLYLSNLYIAAFANTVTDPSAPDWSEASRFVFGAGLRSRFRISNMTLDIGIGIGYEPSRGQTNVFVGDF